MPSNCMGPPFRRFCCLRRQLYIYLSAQASRMIRMAAPLSKREAGAWRGFLRAHARLWKELGADLEARHGLSINAYDVLVLLDEAPLGRERMTDLANAVLMSSGGFTRLADRLERQGLIARERCPTDARGFDAVLTELGRAKLEEARETHR